MVARQARRLVGRVPDGASLPGLARVPSRGWAWRAAGREVHAVRLSPGPPVDTGADLAAHLPPRCTPVERWSGRIAVALDGLPLVGPLPGRPAALIAGLADTGHAYTLAAARWAAEALVTGADPTPARFRAARAFG
jgi:glycine/D-amino acid oxidase-like deaminating enzyme